MEKPKPQAPIEVEEEAMFIILDWTNFPIFAKKLFATEEEAYSFLNENVAPDDRDDFEVENYGKAKKEWKITERLKKWIT
jgi:hypothetical protein